MLKKKYESVLKLGEELGVQNGFVEEEAGKLRIGGVAPYQFDKDRLWDSIKKVEGWEVEVEADIKVANADPYGFYTVQSGDTLSRIARNHLGKSNRYMEIFNLNQDQLKNPDLIKVGQKLKLPAK